MFPGSQPSIFEGEYPRLILDTWLHKILTFYLTTEIRTRILKIFKSKNIYLWYDHWPLLLSTGIDKKRLPVHLLIKTSFNWGISRMRSKKNITITNITIANITNITITNIITITITITITIIPPAASVRCLEQQRSLDFWAAPSLVDFLRSKEEKSYYTRKICIATFASWSLVATTYCSTYCGSVSYWRATCSTYWPWATPN